ncbi:MAG TPA: molecular chaperone DnaJ [Synechococcales bacterium UBA10510]|nr:molecular chaperone DnaJ [Synechococcales bacterium UBA10510]
MSGPSHYQLLQVAPTASREELRQAFRLLSKRFHPDTTELPLAEAERSFQQLRLAYAVLSDPAARERYDGELRHGALLAAANPVTRVRPPGARPDGVRRALSGGEWLALLLLGIALVFSLVLGVGLAWLRGAELFESPSWWQEARLQRSIPMPPIRPMTPMPTLTPMPLPNSSTPAYGGETSAGADPKGIKNQLTIKQPVINIGLTIDPAAELNAKGDIK